MSALVRYQLELLLRSQRWLPPFLGYLLLLVTGITMGNPLLDSLGFAAAVLVPVSAWYVRSALTADPAPARAVLVAASGPVRVQLASLAAAVIAGLTLAVLSVAGIWLASGHTTNDPHREVSAAAAAFAGLLGMVACVLTGLAVGVLCNRPVLLRGGYGILGTLGLSVLVLVVGGSPANLAIRALVTGSREVRVELPWLALLGALLLAALLAAASAAVARRRTE
ncbi:hypothetical protein [Kitasatospora azatica]|uniref:hypothetical protein n=1 Tax=Kitasatospora azatica TaxID=58347 RepID=UPI000568FAFA|nr:hypothetical protein [Kitasatospora azatica]